MPVYALPPIPKTLDFPDTERPYVESVRGRREPKVSPKWIHGRLTVRLGRWLDDWAGSHGAAVIECRFYLVAGDARPSSLVPDVAYVSYARLPHGLPDDARERPRIAPDIAVEIVSPGDRKETLAEKVDLYLAYGARVVVVVYPQERAIVFHSAAGALTCPAHGVLRLPAYDDLVLDADWLFTGL